MSGSRKWATLPYASSKTTEGMLRIPKAAGVRRGGAAFTEVGFAPRREEHESLRPADPAQRRLFAVRRCQDDAAHLLALGERACTAALPPL